MDVILLLLASYGAAFGLVNDKVPGLRWFRRFPLFDRMFGCIYCTGFHAGWFGWSVFGPGGVRGSIEFGFASAAFCYAFDAGVRWFEASSDG